MEIQYECLLTEVSDNFKLVEMRHKNGIMRFGVFRDSEHFDMFSAGDSYAVSFTKIPKEEQSGRHIQLTLSESQTVEDRLT